MLGYSLEETDFIALRNIQKIEQILANSDNVSLADLLKLEKKDVYGVPSELREKLVELIKQKAQEEFIPYQLPTQEEKTSLPTPEDEEESEQLPTPPPPKRRKSEPEEPIPNNNKDQIINDLHEEIAKLQAEVSRLEGKNNTPDSQQVQEVNKQIEKTREKIIKSNLDENKKQELLKLLDKLANKNKVYIDNEVETSSSSHNYDLV